MAKVLENLSVFNGITSGDTFYFPISGRAIGETTESRAQVAMRTAGTFADMKVYVSANSIGADSTAQFRKDTGGGPANGNLVVTITASTTGYFEDTTHSDTANAGDKFDTQYIGGVAAGSLNIALCSVSFSATTNTAQRLVASDGSIGATTPIYLPLNGTTTSNQVTEADVQFKFRTGGTLKNGFVNVYLNTQTTTVTFKTRKGAANGNVTMSVTAGATGVFEDTTNSDTVTSADLWNWTVSGSDAVHSLSFKPISVEFVTTDSSFEFVNGHNFTTGVSFSASLTRYMIPGTIVETGQSTETNTSIKSPMAFQASKLGVFVVTNGGTTDGTFDFRNGAVSTALTITMTALTTGYFEDTTHTANVSINDLINFRIVTGATAATVIGMLGMRSGIAVASSFIPRMMLMGVG